MVTSDMPPYHNGPRTCGVWPYGPGSGISAGVSEEWPGDYFLAGASAAFFSSALASLATGFL